MPEGADALTGLYGLRALAPTLADVVGALALGLLLAAASTGIVAGLPRLRRPRPERAYAARLEDARALPPVERTVALASLLRDMADRHAPGDGPWAERARTRFRLQQESFAALGTDLYRPDAAPDPSGLERAVETALARLGT